MSLAIDDLIIVCGLLGVFNPVDLGEETISLIWCWSYNCCNIPLWIDLFVLPIILDMFPLRDGLYYLSGLSLGVKGLLNIFFLSLLTETWTIGRLVSIRCYVFSIIKIITLIKFVYNYL